MGVPRPTTAEVVALRSLGRTIDEVFVAWAVGMLEVGRDSPSLRVLAGESAPFHPFEMEALVDRVFHELEIAPHGDRAQAARALAKERIRAGAGGHLPRAEVLRELARLHLDFGLEDLHDFFLLHHAHGDLRASDVQWYWPGADRDNIDSIVDEKFASWLRGSGEDGGQGEG